MLNITFRIKDEKWIVTALIYIQANRGTEAKQTC